jgi:hypothetical protein
MVKLGVVLLVASLLCQASSPSQPNRVNADQVSLNLRVGAVSHKPVSIYEAFSIALASTRTPGGLVIVRNCDGKEPQTKIPPNATLREALDQLVKDAPHYRWSVDEGVVNLIPQTNDSLLLKTRIAEVKVERASPLEAFRQVIEQPEVKFGIAGYGLRPPTLRAVIGPTGINQRNKVTLDLKDVTLQKALNRLVREDGRRVWAYTLVPCKNEYGFSFVVQ